MANNIEYWSEEYGKEVSALEEAAERLVEESEHCSPAQLNKLSAQVDDKLALVKKAKKFYGLEMRLIKDRAERASYEGIGKDLDARVQVAANSAKSLQEKASKKELLAGKEGLKNPYDTEGKTNDDLLQGANKIQDLTFESLARTRQMIEASKEVGTSTLEELARQREQIKDIDNEVTQIDSKLVRAEKMVVNFTRRMASDRLIQLCAGINIVVMICLCMYVGITGKKFTDSSSSSSNVGPPNISSAPTVSLTASPTTSLLASVARTAHDILWGDQNKLRSRL